MNPFFGRALACAAAMVLTVLAPLSVAQSYPNRALRVVVAFAPGGSTDLLARVVGQRLAESLVGQPVIVDNRPAGGGTTGSDLVAKTPKPLVARLNEETTKILRRPDVQETLTGLSMDIIASRPEEYRAFIKAQMDLWTPVVKASGARVD